MTPTELRRLAATLDAGIRQRMMNPVGDGFCSGDPRDSRVVKTGAPRTRILRVIADALDANIESEREATDRRPTSARALGASARLHRRPSH